MSGSLPFATICVMRGCRLPTRSLLKRRRKRKRQRWCEFIVFGTCSRLTPGAQPVCLACRITRSLCPLPDQGHGGVHDAFQAIESRKIYRTHRKPKTPLLHDFVRCVHSIHHLPGKGKKMRNFGRPNMRNSAHCVVQEKLCGMFCANAENAGE